MSFIEQRLFESISYGFSGGPTWNTGQVPLRSGIIRRNIKRSRPLSKFKGSFNNRDKPTFKLLLDAFNATQGAAYGFRFKNWLDFEALAEPLGVAVDGAQTVQLVKGYAFGSKTTSVPIRKPNADVIVYADGSPIAATVDTTTGEAALTSTAGAVLTWSGTYDIPVMFENDDFMATLMAVRQATVEVSLIEDLAA